MTAPAPRLMPAVPPVLLRYRFDNQAQLARHLHPLEGRVALFFPSARVDTPAGAVVALEVSIGDTGQSAVMRGVLLSRTPHGLWVAFQDLRILRRLSTSLLRDRTQARYGTDLLIRIASPACIGRLLDVSLGGARLISSGRLTPGDTIELSLIAPRDDVPTQLGRARVMRSTAGEAAVKFLREDPLTRRATMGLLNSVQREWLGAAEVAHPAVCCREHGVMVPVLPRVKEGAVV